MSNLKAKIIKKTYSLVRKHIMHILTNNLGKVVEEKDRIICYVDRHKIERMNNSYLIGCIGIEYNEELAKAYDLAKPIHYIIDGLTFSKKQVYIFGYEDCNVEIRNCSFNWGCVISIKGTCTIEKTYIRDFYNLNIWATNLKLIDMQLNEMLPNDSNFSLGIEADEKLDLINTKISKKIKVYLDAQEAKFINSSIEGATLNCKISKIKMDDKSHLGASELVNINTTDFEKIPVKSPKVIYNGVDVSNNTNIVTLETITDPLKIKRMELINVLKPLKSKCDEKKLDQLNQCEEKLNQTSLSRLLKK